MTTRLERIRNLCECLKENNDDILNLKSKMFEIADEIERICCESEFYTERIAVLSKMEQEPDETYNSDDDKYSYSSCNKNPFMKPIKMPNELALFLDVETGTEWSRLKITKQIMKYIKENSLQDKDDKRKINPDERLKTLLKLKEGDELNFYNFQVYLSRVYNK